MTIVIMLLAGCVAGFALDNLIARMAAEPYQRGEAEAAATQPAGTALDLASEAGSLAMPALLTDRWWLRRALVVAATAALFALAGWRYTGDPWQLPIIAAYVSALVICASTDLLSFRVPNTVTYPAIAGALALGLTLSDANRLDVVAGGLLFGGLLFVPSLLTGGAMGMGDVKLALFVGFALGLTFVVPAMLLMAISGGVAATLMLVTRIRHKGDPIPYAPFIAGAALVVMLLQGTAFRTL